MNRTIKIQLNRKETTSIEKIPASTPPKKLNRLKGFYKTTKKILRILRKATRKH